MGNLVFVSGDFRAGTTLLFTLFRKTDQYHCLYEPLHERLPIFLKAGLPIEERHFFVDNYFKEYRGFHRISALHDSAWGTSRLRLTADDDAEPMRRYLSYLIEQSFKRRRNVVLQFNRAAFRLGWLRRHFPKAKVVHIWRDPREQWRSIVGAVQRHHARQDVGQNSPSFTGFNLSTWCDDLRVEFPELEASRSTDGFERFTKLWKRSLREHRTYADISVCFADLTSRFESQFREVREAVHGQFAVQPLQRYVVSPARRDEKNTTRLGRLSRSAAKTAHGFRVRLARVSLALSANKRRQSE